MNNNEKKFALNSLLYIFLTFMSLNCIAVQSNLNIYEDGTLLYEVESGSMIDIILPKDSINKLIEYKKNAHDSLSENIDARNKKWVYAKLKFYKSSTIIECDSKVRINGDWKDHLYGEEHVTSLKIKTTGECPFYYKSFKLFVEESRSGASEILYTMLLRENGVIAPYTRRVIVRSNGVKYTAIFQEDISTAMLESQGYRESPILEEDERQLWLTRNYWYLNRDKLKFYEDFNSKLHSTDSGYFKIINKEFLGSEAGIKIAEYALSQATKNIVTSDGGLLQALNSKFAPHANIFHNKRYAYNPLLNNFVPIYYDGNVGSDINWAFSTQCTNDIIYHPNDDFVAKYTDRSIGNLSYTDLCFYDQFMRLKNSFHTKMPVPVNYSGAISEKSPKSGIPDIYNPISFNRGGVYYLCQFIDGSRKCEIISVDHFIKVIAGEATIQVSGLKIPVLYVGSDAPFDVELKLIEGQLQEEYFVNEHELLFIQPTDRINGDLKIKLNGKNSRVVINGEIGNANITLFGDAPNLYNDVRFNNQMLTGCLTIYRSRVFNSNIKADVSGCEDALNVVSTNGIFDNVEITKSTGDGLDMDFSNIHTANLRVRQSDNDCVDVSYGNYTFDSLIVSNCTDKAVSIGEGSKVSIDSALTRNTTYGIVVKDDSMLSLTKVDSELPRSKCVTALKKKARFGTPHFVVKSYFCSK